MDLKGICYTFIYLCLISLPEEPPGRHTLPPELSCTCCYFIRYNVYAEQKFFTGHLTSMLKGTFGTHTTMEIFLVNLILSYLSYLDEGEANFALYVYLNIN